MKRKYHVTVYTWGDQVLYQKIDERDLRPHKGLKKYNPWYNSFNEILALPIKNKSESGVS